MVDRRLLGRRLSLGGGHGSFGLPDLRLRLCDRREVVTVVRADERLTRLHELVVREGTSAMGARDLRADSGWPRVDEGVVGVRVVARVEPPRDAACGGG